MAPPRWPSAVSRKSRFDGLLRRTLGSGRATVVATRDSAPFFNSSAQEPKSQYRPRNQRIEQYKVLHGQYSQTLLEFERRNPVPDSVEERAFTKELTKLSKDMTATMNGTATSQQADDQASEMMTQCALFAARQLFSTWKAFDRIPAEPGVDISLGELAAAVNADEALVRRLAGVLVSHDVLLQTSKHCVAHTAKSLELREGHSVGKRCQLFWEVCMVPFAQEPRFFQTYGRKEPQTMNHVPSTFAYGLPEDTYYSMLEKDPERMVRFGGQMRAMEINMPSAGIYDFSWLVERVRQEEEEDMMMIEEPRSLLPETKFTDMIGAGISPSFGGKRAIFVDVGGGMGQASKAIMAENPGLPPSRFVLQDRAEVVTKVEAMNDPGLQDVSKMVVNFHAEQPVKGAYVYFIRRCLFNFPDGIALNMLCTIAGSMSPRGQSRLLIQEDVMEDPPSPRMSAMDMIMLSLGGKQRSLEQWRELASYAGLKVVGVHRDRSGRSESLCVIECVLDDGTAVEAGEEDAISAGAFEKETGEAWSPVSADSQFSSTSTGATSAFPENSVSRKTNNAAGMPVTAKVRGSSSSGSVMKSSAACLPPMMESIAQKVRGWFSQTEVLNTLFY